MSEEKVTTQQLNIDAIFPIFKVGDRTFIIDNKPFNNNIIYRLIKILENGFNFIICSHFNIQSTILNIVKDFDSKYYNFKSFFMII